MVSLDVIAKSTRCKGTLCNSNYQSHLRWLKTVVCLVSSSQFTTLCYGHQLHAPACLSTLLVKYLSH